MNIVNFINDLISHLDCGCFIFGSILQDRSTLDAFNLADENKCCTIVFVEDYRVLSGYTVQPLATMQRTFRTHCDFVFNLLFLEASRADLQYHDETQFHEVSESRWNTYIQPKLDCLQCFDLTDCEILDSSYDLIKWNVIPEQNVSANFFDGVRVEIIIRKYGKV